MTTLTNNADPVSLASSGSTGLGVAALRPVCPRCSQSLSRIQQRPIDRFLNLFVSVERYRCGDRNEAPACAWQGTLRREPAGEGTVLDHPGNRVQPQRIRVLRQMRALWGQIARHGRVRDAPAVDESSRVAFGDFSFEDMAQITLDSIGDAVLVVDPKGTVIYLNKVAETLTGWSSEMALGQAVDEVFRIVDGTTRQRAMSPSRQAIGEDRIVGLALGSVLIRRDGTDLAIEDSAAPIHNSLGTLAGAVIVFHHARQSETAIQEMSHLARHDFLTGLPNRGLLVERLTQAVGMAKRHSKQVALLFLDLDDFKQHNDAFGHGVGDQLLRDMAADMMSCVRTTDTISRHGGDEFVILLTEIEGRQDAARIAENLLARLNVPRVIDGHELQVTLSVGISVYPEDGIDADALMLNADKAMYSAKTAGGNTYQCFQRPREQARLPHPS